MSLMESILFRTLSHLSSIFRTLFSPSGDSEDLAAAGASDALGLGKTLAMDLLITLAELAEASGVGLAEKIREMQPEAKVLLIAESGGREPPEAFNWISKPFTSEALLRKIRKILG